MSITFDRSLVTGNEMTDTQRQRTDHRVNRLAEECVPGTEKRTAVETSTLLDYTDYHFTEEEALEKKSGYPKLSAHHLGMRNLRKPWKICGLGWRRKRGPAKRSWTR